MDEGRGQAVHVRKKYCIARPIADRSIQFNGGFVASASYVLRQSITSSPSDSFHAAGILLLTHFRIKSCCC